MAETPNSTFSSHNHEGRNVNGQVIGGIVVLGDYHAAGQSPSISSPCSSQPSTEEWQQKLVTVQMSLKEMYLQRFKKTNPFSFPFTFDIEDTWVSLVLKADRNCSQVTENHAELLRNAFSKEERMLIIEGKPATGKTSLMRRLAYEWAKGNKELSHFDLIAYAEFREVREQAFESNADMVLEYTKNHIGYEELINLKSLLSNRKFCGQRKILLLLDGYDESSLNKQCKELTKYFTLNTIESPLSWNVVITTRPGYLTVHRGSGNKGRFVFADVLGFITPQQKEKYIHNHFKSTDSENGRNIETVLNLLNNNNNLIKLAETPLFLTFICLTHEKIRDGTTLELYCNIIWWLIDRHQRDFPDRDVPSSFDFHKYSSDKFKTIQNSYLLFPQLQNLGKMAFSNLEEDVFKKSDCNKFNVNSIHQQVGLLRKEKKRDNYFRQSSAYFFPHRTIQEFLAAFYFFCLDEQKDQSPQCFSTVFFNLFSTFSHRSSTEEFQNKFNLLTMTEYEKFLLRVALSDNMPVNSAKQKNYFEIIHDIDLDITFDAFNTTAGFSSSLLNKFLSQCTNVRNIQLWGKSNTEKNDLNSSNETHLHNQTVVSSTLSSPILFSFSNLAKLHSVTFDGCTFEANSQLSFNNCPSMKNLQFWKCGISSSTNLAFATLPAIDTVLFYGCKIDLATWQAITDQIKNSSIKCLKLSADYFAKEFYSAFLHHLQKCERIEQIHVKDYYDIINYNEEVTANLTLTAQKLPGLTSITISDEYGRRLDERRRLKERNKERIEKAGQERNTHFLIKYVE